MCGWSAPRLGSHDMCEVFAKWVRTRRAAGGRAAAGSAQTTVGISAKTMDRLPSATSCTSAKIVEMLSRNHCRHIPGHHEDVVREPLPAHPRRSWTCCPVPLPVHQRRSWTCCPGTTSCTSPEIMDMVFGNHCQHISGDHGPVAQYPFLYISKHHGHVAHEPLPVHPWTSWTCCAGTTAGSPRELLKHPRDDVAGIWHDLQEFYRETLPPIRLMPTRTSAHALFSRVQRGR